MVHVPDENQERQMSVKRLTGEPNFEDVENTVCSLDLPPSAAGDKSQLRMGCVASDEKQVSSFARKSKGNVVRFRLWLRTGMSNI